MLVEGDKLDHFAMCVLIADLTSVSPMMLMSKSNG
jgi:hypothetical protein